MKALICVDVQNDFVKHDGALPCPHAEEITEKIIKLAKECRSKGWAIYATADTHKPTDWKPEQGKGKTLEASVIPEHCLVDTDGHKIVEGLVKDENRDVIIQQSRIFDKVTFGSTDLVTKLEFEFKFGTEFERTGEPLEEIVLCGFCTGICVLANAILLRTAFPNTRITVLQDYCGDLTNEDHERALHQLTRLLIDIG